MGDGQVWVADRELQVQRLRKELSRIHRPTMTDSIDITYMTDVDQLGIMGFAGGIIVVLAVHTVFFVLLKVLSVYAPQCLFRFLDRYNLRISFGVVRCETPVFNTAISACRNFARRYRRVLRIWFTIGGWVGLLGLCLCVIFMPINFYLTARTVNFFSRSATPPLQPTNGRIHETSQPPLQPLIPGVNIPLWHSGYILLVLLISAVWHELGHALAGAIDCQHFSGVGVFFAFVYPGAFVNFTSTFEQLPEMNRIQIFAAGAWHNFVCALVAYVLLAMMPFLLLPLYSAPIVHSTASQQLIVGAAVVSVHSESPLRATLQQGDVVTSVNGCAVTSSQKFHDCVLRQDSTNPLGYCSSYEYWVAQNISTACCNAAEFHNTVYQCFAAARSRQEPTRKTLLCGSARQITANSQLCSSSLDCDDDSACFLPHSVVGEHSTLIRLEVYRKNQQEHVLWSGNPIQLSYHIGTSDHLPRLSLSWLHGLPRHLETFLSYLLALSLGLGILNVAPVHWLDGQHIISAIPGLLQSATRLSSAQIRAGTGLFLSVMTVVLLITLSLSLYGIAVT